MNREEVNIVYIYVMDKSGIVKYFLIIYFVLLIVLSVEFIKKGDFFKELLLMYVIRLSFIFNF